MKFIIKTGIDIVGYIFIMQLSNFMILGSFANKGILGNLLVSIFVLLVLYCINISFDEIIFLKGVKSSKCIKPYIKFSDFSLIFFV